MRRPVEVKEDVRRMEERQRVKRILQSRAFRDELEELVIELQAGGAVSSTSIVQRPLPTAGSHQSQTPSLIGHGKLIAVILLIIFYIAVAVYCTYIFCDLCHVVSFTVSKVSVDAVITHYALTFSLVFACTLH